MNLNEYYNHDYVINGAGRMNYTKENKMIYGTTCPSCGVFTLDKLALNPKDAQLRRAAPDMYEALKLLLNRYISMVESGDCGFWDCSNEEWVIKSRQALSKVEDKQ